MAKVPKVVKIVNVREMMEEVQKKIKENIAKLEENGGMCVNCGKRPAETENPDAISQFHCIICNAKSKKLVDELKKRPGFSHIKIR